MKKPSSKRSKNSAVGFLAIFADTLGLTWWTNHHYDCVGLISKMIVCTYSNSILPHNLINLGSASDSLLCCCLADRSALKGFPFSVWCVAQNCAKLGYSYIHTNIHTSMNIYILVQNIAMRLCWLAKTSSSSPPPLTFQRTHILRPTFSVFEICERATQKARAKICNQTNYHTTQRDQLTGVASI